MLAVLVPSRGRPHNLNRLLAAIDDTATGDCVVYTYIDDDDPELDEYRSRFHESGVQMMVGQRIYYAAAINALAEVAANDGALHLAMFGDDVVPETRGWDATLIAVLGGRLGVAYGSDGLEHLHGPDLPTHFVTQTELYRRLGWLALPGIRHLFLDNVAREIGKGLGNFRYVPEVRLTHRHRWNRTAPDDQTYRDANDKRKREQDERVYLAWRNGPGYRETMERLR